MNDLEKIIDDATNPFKTSLSTENYEKVFTTIKMDPEACQKSLRILAHRIQSPSEREAINSLLLVDFCANKLDSCFLNEMGKYKFLNEIVKLLSPKFLGAQTPSPVKEKCAYLLYQWKERFSSYDKFLKTYEMLVSQGDIDPDQFTNPKVYEPPPKSKSSYADLLENSSKGDEIKNLLKSKNPDDLNKANRLIKELIEKDAERIELENNRKIQLDNVEHNSKLLCDLLQDNVIDDEKIALVKDVSITLRKELDTLNNMVNSIDDEELCTKKTCNSLGKGLSISADNFSLVKENSFLSNALAICDKTNEILKKTTKFLENPSSCMSSQRKEEVSPECGKKPIDLLIEDVSDDLSQVNFSSSTISMLTPVPVSVDDENMISFTDSPKKTGPQHKDGNVNYDVFREIAQVSADASKSSSDGVMIDFSDPLDSSKSIACINPIQPSVDQTSVDNVAFKSMRSVTHPPSKADRDNSLFQELDFLGRNIFKNSHRPASPDESLLTTSTSDNNNSGTDFDQISITLNDICPKGRSSQNDYPCYTSDDHMIKINLKNFQVKSPISCSSHVDIWLVFFTNQSTDIIENISLDFEMNNYRLKKLEASAKTLQGFVEFLPVPTMTQLFLINSLDSISKKANLSIRIAYSRKGAQVKVTKVQEIQIFA